MERSTIRIPASAAAPAFVFTSFMTQAEHEALERLIAIALRDDGQRKRKRRIRVRSHSELVANFLLAWWDASLYGGFDLKDAAVLDAQIQADVLTVFHLIVRAGLLTPDLYLAEFQKIIRRWRPDLKD